MTSIGRRDFIKLAGMAILAGGIPRPLSGAEKNIGKPNIVVILSDDQGYGDASCYEHPPEVRTPNIDRLAASGIRFTDGYASGWVCAPTRAGLLTGRYQQRFGFYRAPDSRIGMPTSEITIADILKQHGYATGVFGKWHVGLGTEYHPLQRGFDEFYGFLGHGAHDYFDLKPKEGKEFNAIYRNDKIISDTGYLTDNLGREAVSFVERHKNEPFFLYLPFNAVHWPMHAPKEDIERFDTKDENRNILMAMLHRMDAAIGTVLDTLRQTGADENTLIFFFSDNGGAKKNSSNNGSLRDYKGSSYEGGVRVPFIVSWPGELPQGTVCREPVISLDILPTICAAVGISLPGDRVYDGRNMLPMLRGEATEPLHEALFWDGAETHWGVRMGKWKLVHTRKEAFELYDLEVDTSETNNLAEEHPEIVEQLKRKYLEWKSKMAPQMKKRMEPGRGNRKRDDRIRNRQQEN